MQGRVAPASSVECRHVGGRRGSSAQTETKKTRCRQHHRQVSKCLAVCGAASDSLEVEVVVRTDLGVPPKGTRGQH